MNPRKRKLSLATLLFVSGIFILNISNDMPISFGPLSSEGVRQKVLIILTQTRSGSSFTGEVFAATNNSMYLYEPLYPFGFDCTAGIPNDVKLKLLKQILSCNFTNLDETYEYGFNVSGWKDGAWCRKHGFCFTTRSVGLENSYRKACKEFKPSMKDCRFPMRGEILEKVCRKSSLIVTKITRVCSVVDLEDIYQQLKRMKKDTYVLHLVRDLRSIASSKIKLMSKANMQQAKGNIITRYCPRQRLNIEYLHSVSRGKTSSIIGDGRYKRIRYEDFATNAIESATKVFQFMNLPLPSEVSINIQNNLHPNITRLKERVEKGGEGSEEAAKMLKKLNSSFATVRDPFEIVSQWRNVVSFEAVKSIQEKCGEVLKKLGYKLFASEKEMKDFSVTSY